MLSISIDNFLNSPKYDEVVENLSESDSEGKENRTHILKLDNIQLSGKAKTKEEAIAEVGKARACKK
jgi:hypothetical protein